jgi:hypothetical protein
MSAIATSKSERLELANRLYREYRAQCFWHSPPDLVITEDLIPLVVKGLRKHGGRRGFIVSKQLQPSRKSERELLECR